MGQTGRRSIATHILAVKIALAAARFLWFRGGPPRAMAHFGEQGAGAYPSAISGRRPGPSSPRPLAAPWLLCTSNIDLLKLVVPEQKRAPVIQEHVEGQVLWVAPLSADRARKPPPLGAKPSLAHHHLRADSRFF